MINKRRGKIKWIGHRNFGFILSDQNDEVWFHLNDSTIEVKVGLPVEYELGRDKQGRTKAIAITCVAGVNDGKSTT